MSSNFYCGNSKKSPKEYDRLGSRYECLSKGVGVGKYLESNKKDKYIENETKIKKLKQELKENKKYIKDLEKIIKLLSSS
jgi:predicted RNase H-like nuclease (RuvC/YqgF family)